MVALNAWWREAARISSANSFLVAAWLASVGLPAGFAADPIDKEAAAAVQLGRTLFAHQWSANDARSHGGDGLGPVFNAASCVACHEQGGIGGAGPLEANVQVLSRMGQWKLGELRKVHIGLVDQPHVVLHKSGPSEYGRWHKQRLALAHATPQRSTTKPEAELSAAEKNLRNGMRRQIAVLSGNADAGAEELEDDSPALVVHKSKRGKGTTPVSFQKSAPGQKPRELRGIVASDRSTTSLFGVGLIDAIDDATIEQVARDEMQLFPKVAGRVSRLADKKVGRFGWHAQMANLREFTLTACAVEVGLEVPGHPQAGNPLQPDYRPHGFDMNRAECDALVAYIAQLPRPVEKSHPRPTVVDQGRDLFDKVGCADCHRPDLGAVSGLYSDLLLHDMGPDLQAGKYGAFTPLGDPQGDAAEVPADADKKKLVEAVVDRTKDLLWRTPPLWGVASSAPYLHDGRAETLAEAIKLHAGQGQDSADKFAELKAEERQSLLTFLSTLIAPPTAEQLPRGGGMGWGRINNMPRNIVGGGGGGGMF